VKTRVEIAASLSPLSRRDSPAGRLIHLILDDYGSHKQPQSSRCALSRIKSGRG
jgi:hypothetical protein